MLGEWEKIKKERERKGMEEKKKENCEKKETKILYHHIITHRDESVTKTEK